MRAGADGRPPAEAEIDVGLVRRLLAAQFPQWSGLPLTPVYSAGLDNMMYRLGGELAVRLPRRRASAGQTEKEQRWLPILAPELPLEVPEPVGAGKPGEGYPWHWTVTRWLTGRIAPLEPVADLRQSATVLAEFVTALQSLDARGGPSNEFRGGPLAGREYVVRGSIKALRYELDPGTVTAAWEAALAVPVWQGRAVWLHGDLHPANLLVERGRLTAVLDFGLLSVGDPACDLMVAWTFLSAAARELFRDAVSVDATWARGRGWALHLGLMCAAHAADNPVLGAIGRDTVSEVLADHGYAAWPD
jgi:aminoglycoside phosphotransferase (APT) family kinase protein